MARSFLARLFRGGGSDVPETSEPPANSLAEGERVYAIGDIHGRSDLLDELLERIRDDLRSDPAPMAEIVYLGDYLDRGDDSFGVLNRIADPSPDLPRATALMGNHERVLLDMLAGESEHAKAWRSFGGFETLRSYGIEPTAIPGRHWFEHARDELAARMPAAHRALLESLAFAYDRPPYFFCHAGIRPGVPLAQQEPQTLLWIRDEFLRSEADFGRVVVHGHTPVPAPDVRRNRINVDTGAYKSGRLTCAVLEVGSVRLMQTGDARAV